MMKEINKVEIKEEKQFSIENINEIHDNIKETSIKFKFSQQCTTFEQFLGKFNNIDLLQI